MTRKPRMYYRRLMDLPAWGLYRKGKCIAGIRACDAYRARELFKAMGLQGDRVTRLEDPEKKP